MEDQPVSDDALSAARDLFEAGHYAGVVAICCQALEERPRRVAMLLERARAWIALGRSTQAINDLHEVISIEPSCGGAHRALGRLLLHRGDLEAARHALAGALELDREDRELREQLEAVDAALVVEGALALEDALAAEDEALRVAAGEPDPELELEIEATLDEEACDLEAALAREQELAEHSGACAVPRLATAPMDRAPTSAAQWRAPTLPMARPEEEVRGAQVVPIDRTLLGKGRRAATVPMERTPGSAAPWRAPTLPVRRPTALAALASEPPAVDPDASAAPPSAWRESPPLGPASARAVPPSWQEGQQARGTGSGRAFDEQRAAADRAAQRRVDEQRAAADRRAAEELLAAADRRAAEELLAAADRRAAEERSSPVRRNITSALIRREPAAVPRVRSAGLTRPTTVPFHRGRTPTVPLYGRGDEPREVLGEAGGDAREEGGNEGGNEARSDARTDARAEGHSDGRAELRSEARGTGSREAVSARPPRLEPERPAEPNVEGDLLGLHRAGTVPLPRRER